MPVGANRKKCILTVPDKALRNFFWKHDIYCCICMITWIRIPNTDRDSYGSETLLRWQPYWLYKRILWAFPYTVSESLPRDAIVFAKVKLGTSAFTEKFVRKTKKSFSSTDRRWKIRRKTKKHSTVGTVSGFLFRGIPVPIKLMHVCF